MIQTQHIARRFQRTLAGIALSLLPIGVLVPAYGQTAYTTGLNNMVTAIRGDVFPNTNPVYTTIEFQTGANGVLWVDQNASFNNDIDEVFTTTRFVSDSNNRVSASLLGTDEFITPIDGRFLCVQNLFLKNVDLNTGSVTPGAVQLKIQARNGGDMTLGMNNSSLTGFLPPEFWAPSRLYFNVSGSSQISQWFGTMGSPTSLDVAPGSIFRIQGSGSLSAEFPVQTLNFGYDANNATINGAKLILDQSHLRWGSNVGSTSEMDFSDNATLQLMGQSKLRTHNLSLQNSTLDMANNTRLDVIHDMVMNNSTITAGSGAVIHVDRLIGKGLSSVAANGVALQPSTLDLTTPGSKLVLQDDLDGLAETRVSGEAVLFPTTGAASTLSNQSILTISAASMDLNQRAILVNGPRALIDMQGASFSMDGSAQFTNDRDVIVRRGHVASTAQFGVKSVIGGGTGSTLRLECSVGFNPATRAQNSLSTANELFLDSSNTVVTMYLDPTAKTSDRFILEGQLNIGSAATLTLGVVNDTLLQPGEKFVLFDFNDDQTLVDHFGSLPNGSTFNLGKNVYEILYNDPDVESGSTSFITLTTVTVPEPSSWALLGLGTATIVAYTVRRRS
jgi:hypothetical protein